eukprot:jgi/Botrbrau1/19562/Bobra.0035s0054.1
MVHAVQSVPERVPFPGHADIEAHIDKPSDPGAVLEALRGIAVILGPGAGGSLSSGHLPTTAQTLAEGGLICVRYSIKPPNMSLRMKAVQAIMEHCLRKMPGVTRFILAGHSMGARVAAAVAEERPQQTAACLFFSYPLHPPGKPVGSCHT